MDYVVNARFLASPITGVGRVGRELLAALLDEIAADPACIGGKVKIAAAAGHAPPRAAEIGVECVWGPANALQEQLLFATAGPGATIVNFANNTPLLAGRSIVWIHDAHVFEAPEAYRPAYRLWHKLMLRACVLRGFSVVTVSNYSRDALIRHGARPERTEVIYNGGDHILREAADASLAEREGLAAGSFVLLVGSRAKHKNLPFAIEALSRGLPPEMKIAVVGLHQRGAYTGDPVVFEDPRIRLLPMTTDGQLRALYEQARCVVIPSVLEGFSLPAAEAMWCGAPLVLANRTALPEVGGDAALYFEPNDAAGLVRSVLEASGDRREVLAENARRRRETFRWRDAARRLVERHLR